MRRVRADVAIDAWEDTEAGSGEGDAGGATCEDSPAAAGVLASFSEHGPSPEINRGNGAEAYG